MEQNEIKQITPEEQESLLNIQKSINDLVLILGGLRIQELNLDIQLRTVRDSIEAADQQYRDLIANENTISKNLFDKYGDVNIDIATGNILS